jgi:hypothetical protein
LVAAKADPWRDLFEIVDRLFRQAHRDVAHRAIGIVASFKIARFKTGRHRIVPHHLRHGGSLPFV